jgi:broad specificity phosphatase PhoE
MTTVLLVRHAERDDGSLSGDGLERATELVHAARKAGVTAIYTTDTERTRQTVQPLADALALDPLIYENSTPEQIDTFVAQLRKDHAGEVVLVVSHNPTVPLIIDALGGDAGDCSIGTAYDEYDDLCLVTIHGSDAVEVVNLQYGEPSP